MFVFEKKKLREKIILKRNFLKSFQIKQKSEKIKNTLFAFSVYQESKVIMFYVSFGSEVETKEMIEESLLNKKRIVVPVILKQNLMLSEIYSFDELKKGTYGILEPDRKFLRIISPKKIDLFLVPGIVFDFKGNRIGYGKGYFDRLLLKKRKNAKTIGLAFHLQLINTIPYEKHDIPVNKIITDFEF
ncbi:MAG: 5-formyltetrahydrofolate cyclo-ligase [bacterium]